MKKMLRMYQVTFLAILFFSTGIPYSILSCQAEIDLFGETDETRNYIAFSKAIEAAEISAVELEEESASTPAEAVPEEEKPEEGTTDNSSADNSNEEIKVTNSFFESDLRQAFQGHRVVDWGDHHRSA